MSNELLPANGHTIAVRNGDGPNRFGQRRALMPADYAEAFSMASAMAKSKLFQVESAEQAVVILMTGMELGLAPAQAMRGIYVVKGRPTLSADMMVGICKNSPVCEYFIMVESTGDRATYKTKRIGDPEPISLTFTKADAERAGLWGKGTWVQYPSQLLRARCISGLAKIVYPDLLLGLYTEEEAESIPPASMRDARSYVRENDPKSIDPPAAAPVISAKAIDAPAPKSKGAPAKNTEVDPLGALRIKIVNLRESASPEVRSAMKARLDNMGGWGKIQSDKDSLAYYHDEYKKAIEDDLFEPPTEVKAEGEPDPFAGDAQPVQPALLATEPTKNLATAGGK